MKTNRDKAIVGACVFLASGIFYLIDCFLAHRSHQDVSWIASGIYSPGPFGFWATAFTAIFGLAYFIFYSVKSLFKQ